MKTSLPSTPRGQALVLIALAAIGLFAFAALAIDGSSVFSDRRHSQNASDTSALAAALAIVRGKSESEWKAIGQQRAVSNGYDTSAGATKVYIHLCSDHGVVTDEGITLTCQGLPAGANESEYVHVYIKSVVKLFFARVIGWQQVINHTDAVARAIPFSQQSIFGGRALVALNKTACPAMAFKGSSTTTVTGSGIFINSSCQTGSNQAFDASTGSGTFNTPCINDVGGVTLGTNTHFNSPGTTCSNSYFPGNPAIQISDPLALYTHISPCGTTAGPHDATTLHPGNYSGAFPPGSQTTMTPGIYCIDAGNQGFTLQGGASLTGNGILIYMISGNVKWTSGSIHFSAMEGVDPMYDGLLLYMGSGNCDGVSIEGNGNSSFVGTILAPCSQVSLAGGSSASTLLENQIIADTIVLSGSNSLNINFNAKQQWQPPIFPEIQMTQ